MRSILSRMSAISIAAAMMATGCAQLDTATSPGEWTAVAPFGQLVERKARRFDRAWVSPDTNFSLYKGVILESPELAYRTPDRTNRQFPLTAEQKARLKELLAESFAEEFAELEGLQVTQNPGPDVLRLKVRVRDIVATLPQRSAAGPGRFGSIALEALGEATLVLELRDAQSEETLGVAVDSRAIEGAAFLQSSGPVLGWAAAGEACANWAKAARKGLQNLVAKQ